MIIKKEKNLLVLYRGLLWLWSYGSWVYNYLCNQCLSPLMLWVQISIRAKCTTLCDQVCQWLSLVTGRWFSLGTLVSSTNKTDHHDITELLLKVVLNTITLAYFQVIWNITLILNTSFVTLYFILLF
jgi:hypothetical protein